MVELINSFPDFSGSFGDKRIERRAQAALQKLTRGRNSSLRQMTQSEAEQKSFYRLFNNENFSEEGIEQSIVNRCSELCADRHLLCIQDTTEFNLSKQRGRIKPQSGLGKTANSEVLGFMLHSSLVVDAQVGSALGYSYIKAWERKEAMPDRYERNYHQLLIEEKESYKWIAATNQSKVLLEQAARITIIADREGDIYDLLAGVDGKKVNLLVRSNFDRQLTSGLKLSGYLNSLPVLAQHDISVRGDARKNIIKRTANLELKWGKVSIMKSATCNDKNAPSYTEMFLLEAREKGVDKGIYWRLLTTHGITCEQEALQIIEWYKQRWYIEQIHRLLKTEGFRIERSQLEQGWAIRKLTLLAMMATLRILQMMLAYNDDHEQPIDEVFDKEEQKCLLIINEQLQGATDKLKNSVKNGTLKWATWIIARLGGWKGYLSQRKPGPIVLQKGLTKFYHMYEGWSMYKLFSKDVSTP